MADSITETLNVTLKNETAKNATLTGREAATPHGLLIAYCSLVTMALIPIFFGSFRSVGHKKRQKVQVLFFLSWTLIIQTKRIDNPCLR